MRLIDSLPLEVGLVAVQIRTLNAQGLKIDAASNDFAIITRRIEAAS